MEMEPSIFKRLRVMTIMIYIGVLHAGSLGDLPPKRWGIRKPAARSIDNVRGY
jgi:hypothetical protein